MVFICKKFTDIKKFLWGSLFVAQFTTPVIHATPFHGCTFYINRLVNESFASAKPKKGCAEFSAKLGRNGCKKKKCFGIGCITYKGDHVQMWLPDYFIEVTKHFGKSVFAESIDTELLSLQLKLAKEWWLFDANHKAAFITRSAQALNGSGLESSRGSFWHARILTVPYGSLASNYPPLAVAKGYGIPTCFSAISEFFPAQWNYNESDGIYALALAPLGIPICLSKIGATVSGAVDTVKSEINNILNTTANEVIPSNPLQCANPVFGKEGFLKNSLPSSDVVLPVASGDLTKLCMGSWGNLVPRTGWIETEDPYMSAMIAAYKFMSLSGDMHLNPDLKLKDDDKWQIVYPPMMTSRCFKAGSPFDAIQPIAENSQSRWNDELKANSTLKNQTYIIAVWRKRESCEEPLQYINGWNATHKVNYLKNKGVCDAFRF